MNELINLGNGQFVKVTMLKGEKGSSIATITKTGTSGLVDTYTVTLTDGSTTTFEVKNGKTIVSVVKTGTSGLVDTYTITYNDNTTSTFTVTNGRGIERIDKTWTSGLVDTYTITYNDGTTSTFDVTNGNAESLQDAIKASSCAIKAGVSQVSFSQLGNAYITYIPNSECVENAIVVVCFDNGSMYKGTLNYSSTAGRWGISDVSLIQGSDVPATWDAGYGNDSVGTRAFRTGTDFVFSSGVGIALSTSSDVVSYYCVLSSGKVSENYLQEQIDQINTALENKQDKLTNPLTQSDVVNNLTSTSTNKPLSAYQGKLLNDFKQPINDSNLATANKTVAGAINELFNDRVKVIFKGIVTQNTNVTIEPGSGYLLYSWQDANGATDSINIFAIFSGSNNARVTEIISKVQIWAMIPTAGATLVGLYPMSGFYNFVSIIKIY